jgi:hypothetical protein
MPPEDPQLPPPQPLPPQQPPPTGYPDAGPAYPDQASPTYGQPAQEAWAPPVPELPAAPVAPELPVNPVTPTFDQLAQQAWPQEAPQVPLPAAPAAPAPVPAEAAPPPYKEATNLEGIDSDEQLIANIHRHFFGIFTVYILTAVALVVIIGLIYLLLPTLIGNNQGQDYTLLAVIAVGIIAIMAIILYMATSVYYSSSLILTNLNITEVTKRGVFNKKISQLDVSNIEDVNADRKGFFSTMFDYGTLTIETAGAVDNFVLTYCPHPDHYAKEILEARQTVRSMRHEA